MIIFGLHEILSADKNIFSDKSLRSLIQNIEKLSLYLRCYNNLDIDEIITAFLIIFTYNNNYQNHVGTELSNIAMGELRALEDEVTEQNREALWNKIQTGIYSPEYCAYMFIKFSMINIRFTELNRYNAYHRDACGYYSGGTFNSDGLMESINLKKFTEVAPVVIARLRYLEDFTPVLPVKETSSAAEPLTDPSA